MSEKRGRVLSFTPVQRYGIAVLGVTGAAVVCAALGPVLMDDLPLFLFVFPIVVAAGIGGLGPGLLATALSLFLGGYVLRIPPVTVVERSVALAGMGAIFSILLDKIRNGSKVQLDTMRDGRQFVQQIIDVSPGVIYVFDLQEKRSVFISRGISQALGYAL